MPPLSSILYPLLFFLLLLSPSTSQLQQNDFEKQILLDLKHQWGDPQALSSWSPTSKVHQCNWTGAECNRLGSIIKLSLENSNLTGKLSPSLCNLTSLYYLDLSYNELGGPFPVVLYNCSSLAHLDLSQNLFVGPIPSDIDRMPGNLADLILSANNFTGDIPVSIGKMQSLRNLYLDSNLFIGSLPAEIANLSELSTLWLAFNPFAPQRISTELGNLKKLESLFMESMNLIGEIPDSFENLTKLQMLSLARNSLTGRIPGGLWSLESLQEIYLFTNNLTGEINGTIGATSLVTIDVSTNQLTGSIPAGFAKLTNLSVLFMYFNQLSGEIPAGIGLLPSLTDLRLFNNKLTGVLPPELGKHSPLRNIEVDDNSLSGELPENLCAQGHLTSIVVFDNNFTGRIPESLGSCSGLNDIMMQRNGFSGELPAGFLSKVNLTTVVLHDNSLSGALPDELPWNLTRMEIQNNLFEGKIPSFSGNLAVFLAGNNRLSGSFPVRLMTASKLQRLSLASNNITGSIPAEISSMRSLTELNLSGNFLTGPIPASLASLPVLTSLDLSSNELNGEIPPAVGNMRLNFLNLSSNKLDGEVPFGLQNPAYDQSFKSNPGLCATSSFLGLQSCGQRSSGSSDVSRGLRIALIVLGSALLLVIAAFGFFVARDCKTRRKGGLEVESWKLTSFRSLDFDEKSIVRGLTDSNLIGSGASGRVYRVEIGNASGEIVAVKKIRNISKFNFKLEKEFFTEVEILGSVRHANIVKLVCCVSSEESKLLVYEYMKNGSLDRWLHERRGAMTRSWPMRLGIAIGAARGLSYMHHDCSPAIVHRDVKCSNILLDEEFRAKIADFGLARMMMVKGEEHNTSVVAGSFGYMAPECAYTTKVNEKMDVYSFGVVLLELTTGREAGDGGEHGGLADLAWHHFQAGKDATDLIDETIRDDPLYLDEIAKVMRLGLICTSTLPSTRPTMKEVVEILLRCNQLVFNVDKQQVEHDDAPLLLSTRGSGHKNNSRRDENNDDDCSNLACNL